MTAIVFDMGGTHLRCGVARKCASSPGTAIAGKTKYRIPNFLTDPSCSQVWEGVVRLVSHYVSSVAEEAGPDAPIVIGFPGPIDQKGKILAAPTIVGHRPSFPDFRAAVQSATRRLTFLLNDMSAAAWGLSASSNATRFIIVTVGSGIGSKIFDRTLGVIDDTPYAGEIGHVLVDNAPTAPMCDCGGRGHLGAIASGRGIERAARLKAKQDEFGFRSSLCSSQFGATCECISNEEHLVPSALAGDPWTLELIRSCTQPLGQMLRSLTIAVGLDRIAVMGGFARESRANLH